MLMQKKNPVTRKLIQEKALCLAMAGGFDNFQASNSWLKKFKP